MLLKKNGAGNRREPSVFVYGRNYMKRKFTLCPRCGGEIEIFEDTDKGDIVSCDGCEREFEVASRRPIHLNLLGPKDKYDAYDGEDENR